MGLSASGAIDANAIRRLAESAVSDFLQPLALAAHQRHAMVQRALAMEDVWAALPEEEAERAAADPDYAQLRQPKQPAQPKPEFIACHGRLGEASIEARLQCDAALAALRLCGEHARAAWAVDRAGDGEGEALERAAALAQARRRAADAGTHLQSALAELARATDALAAAANDDSGEQRNAGGVNDMGGPAPPATGGQNTEAVWVADGSDDVAAQRARPIDTFEAAAKPSDRRKRSKPLSPEEQMAAFRAAQQERAMERERRAAEEAAQREAAQQTHQLMGELRSVLQQLPPRPSPR